MSKDRAIRREAREREVTMKAPARAAERERQERKAARKKALTKRLPKPVSRQTGVLAERKRQRLGIGIAVLVFLNVIVWIAAPEWQARLAAFGLSLLVFPLIAAFV